MANLYIKALFYRCLVIQIMLGMLLVLAVTKARGQAPNISYSSPQVYNLNAAIPPLSPVNNGGAVSPAQFTVASGFGDFRGVAIDHSGNIYVADVTNSQIVKIPAGTSSHVVIGGGFYNPTGVAVDAAGNVYVADFNNNAVKEIPAGSSSTITLGSGFLNPFGIAVDAAGNIYVSDFTANLIKKIPVGSSMVVTVAGGFNKPTGIAVDASGNIFVTDRGNNAIKKIAAGSSTAVTLGSGNGSPNGIGVDATGNVYFVDANSTTLFEIPAGGGSNIVVGSGFSSPQAVALDAANNIYIGDDGNSAVKEIPANSGYVINPGLPPGLSLDRNTGILSGTPTSVSPATNYTITAYNAAGSGSATLNIKVSVPTPPHISYSSPQIYKAETPIHPLSPTNSGGPISRSQFTLDSGFSDFRGVAIDRLGNLYVPDLINNQVLKVPAGTHNHIVIGNGFYNPTGVAVDAAGNVFVADYNYNSVKEIPADGSAIFSIGSGFVYPYGIALDAAGNIYVSDFGVNSIKKILAGTNTVVTIATGFNKPTGIAVDASGNVYVTDRGNNAIKKIVAGSNSVVTLASGNGNPNGIAVDAAGNVYFADGNNTSLIEIPAGGGSPIAFGSGFSNPTALAIDTAKNIYVADDGNGAVKEIPASSGYVVNPPLPAGLSLDINTGVISGAPNAVSPATNYTITAYNNVGGGSATLNIKVNPLTPPQISYSSPHTYLVNSTISPLSPVNSGGGVPAQVPVNIGPTDPSPRFMALDSAGNIYVTSFNSNYVTQIPAGSQGRVRLNLDLSAPAGMAVDAAGNLYIADSGNNEVKEVPANGHAIITLATGFNAPYGLARDAAGDIYVSDSGNNVIKEISAGSGTVTTIAAGFNNPRGIDIDAAGNIYVADRGNKALKKVIAGTGNVITLVGGLNVIDGVKLDAAGNIYFADIAAHLVMRIPAGGSSSIVIDQNVFPNPGAVLPDSHSNLYVANGQEVEMVKFGGYYIAPALPLGLSIDVSTGTITGTPTKASPATDYTVTAYNRTGNGSAIVNIGVSGSADLAALALSSGPLTPAFTAATTSYTATVNNTVTSVTVTPTTAYNTATVTVNGTAVTSGTPSAAISLVVGSNTISIAVTGQNGTDHKTYTINVTRLASANDNLSALRLSSGTLTPAFSATTTSYTASVGATVGSIKITPVTPQNTSTVAVNGMTVASGTASAPIALRSGANVINTIVTAQNGATTKTYTVTITRANSADATLSGLTISSGTLTPTFVSGTTGYIDSVKNAISSVTITPTASDAAAGILVNNTGVGTGTASQAIPLAAGNTTITVAVHSPDGTTNKTYTIAVFRPSANANLSALRLSSGTLSPTFSGVNTTSYTASVANSISSITVTPATAQTTSTVKVNGTAVASGTASGAIALSVGANTINAVVTAQDGTDTKTYTVTLTRAGPINIPDESISIQQPAANPQLGIDGIAVHQGISPNGDGVNDHLVIDGIANYPENKLTIMNRSGALVFESKGYDNNAKVFDGHSNKTGKMQLPGTYFYSLEYTVKGSIKHKTGFIVLKY